MYLQSKITTNEELLSRITTNFGIMVGKPVIKGTILIVRHIINLLVHGAKTAEILQ